jgi:DUF2934 family protein
MSSTESNRPSIRKTAGKNSRAVPPAKTARNRGSHDAANAKPTKGKGDNVSHGPPENEPALVPKIEAANEAAMAVLLPSQDEWRRMVAEAAYYRAERRGFAGGSPEQDWIEAEEDIRRGMLDSGA